MGRQVKSANSYTFCRLCSDGVLMECYGSTEVGSVPQPWGSVLHWELGTGKTCREDRIQADF